MPYILIIDDDEVLRPMLRLTLEHLGYEVGEARDGNEGIALQLRRPADLVITDLVMPNKEGIETIVELRQRFPELRIIAMSGGSRVTATDYLGIARWAGARQILSKPFTPTELAAAIAAALDRDPPPAT
ncbi:MAG: response regulator [Opitutaceae bacterium]|nr:response regulator [Opitutaceae bacterium]